MKNALTWRLASLVAVPVLLALLHTSFCTLYEDAPEREMPSVLWPLPNSTLGLAWAVEILQASALG